MQATGEVSMQDVCELSCTGLYSDREGLGVMEGRAREMELPTQGKGGRMWLQAVHVH